ncbi:MAG: YceI family protein [Ginsengibacter sp.]
MKKISLLSLILFICISQSFAQTYFTKNGRISFFSKTSLENISADNNQVISVFNTATGSLAFSLLNSAFHFPKAKMEDDFNENYMESGKYPKSTFKGIVTDVGTINLLKDGSYNVNVQGDLTIHGITKNISTPGTIVIKDGKISAIASFKVLLKDYSIKVPTIVTNKIAESIEITISCNYEKK